MRGWRGRPGRVFEYPFPETWLWMAFVECKGRKFFLLDLEEGAFDRARFVARLCFYMSYDRSLLDPQ